MSHMDENRPNHCGPVAVVTGSGALRLGNRIARSLADHGYRVALHYRSSAQAAEQTCADINSAGGTAAVFQADVSSESDVDRLMQDVLATFGRIDLLVCTASQWQRRALEEVTAADVRAALETDALGTFLCARRAGLLMAEQTSGGCIINIGDASMDQPRTGEAAYYVAKGVIPAMTRMLAVELAARHPQVRVNAVLPGSVLAPETLTDSERSQRRRETLTRTADDPQSVINAILYLADSSFVTGTSLTIDGGRGIRRAPGESPVSDDR